jgi:hypothetical protein
MGRNSSAKGDAIDNNAVMIWAADGGGKGASVVPIRLAGSDRMISNTLLYGSGESGLRRPLPRVSPGAMRWCAR